MKDWDKVDSFVTHRSALKTLQYIRSNGIEPFLTQQSVRARLLETMLAKFDDGRSKSFFCLAAALLPLDKLETILQDAGSNKMATDKKAISKLLRARLLEIAQANNIELTYRKKV